ncbi:hypothetical protein [Nocardia acidivorans]|uniref:hypothetical protein n=1 Tax=Nocardia acidivorans TaxID=404580 RepID=UPI000833AA85|nr:hypothetical protein [Nocardia acidivorans]
MPSTPTAGQFRKASSSSPQQACVMVYRDDHRTLVWDDKLATVDTAHTSVPLDQCLSFDHDQFEVIQEAIRAGTPVRRILLIAHTTDGHYEFRAAPEYAPTAGTARLRFDQHEYSAFVEAVKRDEFVRSAFTVN